MVRKDLTQKKSKQDLRLKRLIESGLCPADKASEYAKELRKLADSFYDDRTMRRVSKLFKALSDASRIKILKMLSVRSMCVCEIMVALDISQPTTSHHLNILEDAGLVVKKKKGRWIFIELANKKILSLIDELRETTA